MYLLRYEKESLKDYMIYEMSNDSINFMINDDNGFQICYLNNENIIIRIYFKVIFINSNNIEHLLEFINKKFQTSNDNWSIIKNERMIDGNHYTSLYFFSNKYSIQLSKLRKNIDNLYLSKFYFDVSIYYTFNSKYREMITVILPNQSNKYFKYAPIYKFLSGNPKDLIITDVENLVIF
jgi:hypothetical protein